MLTLEGDVQAYLPDIMQDSTRLSGKNLGMIGHFSWLGAKKNRAERDFYNAASAAKI